MFKVYNNMLPVNLQKLFVRVEPTRMTRNVNMFERRFVRTELKSMSLTNCVVKGALYRIWYGLNRLGDSGAKVVCIDSAIFQLLLPRRVASFFSGVYSWLVMTFNYLIL